MRARFDSDRTGKAPAPAKPAGRFTRIVCCLVALVMAAMGVEAQEAGAAAVGVPAVGAKEGGVAFAWPARFGDGDSVGRCAVIESAGGRAFVRVPWWDRSPELEAEHDVVRRALLALRAGGDAAPVSSTVFGGRGFVVFRSLKEGEAESAAYATGASKWFRVASARLVEVGKPLAEQGGTKNRPLAERGGTQTVLRVDQTWFGLYEPTANERGEAVRARGVVLVLPGMLGTPEPVVEGLVARLRERGLAVLRCLTHPARYCAHQEFAIDAADGGAAGLSIVAKELDDRVAEYAYAVREAWRHAVDSREDLKDLPRGVVGMSGGAIALPTVVALEPEKYAAAVLIAGGCNGLEVADRSNYADMLDAVRIEWKGEASFTFKAAAYQEYLKHTTLDGYHTARTLHGKKVLMIHATKDEAVPSRLGQLLWERLGKPERWTYPMGHEGVFAMQMLQNGRTADWVAGALGAASAAPER